MATPRKKLSNKDGSNVLYKQNSGLVYYQRLAEDAKVNPLYGTLYNHATASLSNAQSFAQSNLPHIASSLKVQAQNELKKELMALEKAWGTTFSAETMASPNFYKDLIEAINIVIQSKDVYERNMARIKYGQSKATSLAKIDISQMFGSYFNTFWNNGGQEEMASAIKDHMSEWRDLNAYAMAKAIDSKLPELINNTLIRMFESQPFDPKWGTKDGQVVYPLSGSQLVNQSWQSSVNAGTNPYTQLAEELRTLGGDLSKNTLLQQVWVAMGFDKSREEIFKAVNELKQPERSKKNAIKILSKKIGNISGSASKMGNLAEVILTAIASKVNAGNSNITVIHGGDINKQKADVVFFYRANAGTYLEAQQQVLQDAKARQDAEDSIRIQNVIANTALGKFMSGSNPITQEGFNFIAYVNAKNYTLGKDFRGFHGETEISMNTLSGMLSKDANLSTRGASALISQLVQFTKGAVGDGKDPGPILDSFAETIASFLFDDYATLCTSLVPEGHNALHFFALDGVYIPLSFFLDKISDAIARCSDEMDSFFKFSLLTGKIKYGSLPLEKFERGMWGEQAEEAMAQTKISLIFLRNFQELMRAL